jgi:hemerythrin-like domain-containing protein
MNNPIETLLQEHEIISEAADIIDKLDNLWETDAKAYNKVATGMLEFFSEYADGYHHRKEEDILFPALNDQPNFVLHEMIDEFESHHEDFRNYTNEIRDALKENNFTSSYSTLKEYKEDLLDHIAAENDELFVLAENMIDEGTLESIYFRFQDLEMELGAERKKGLEEMIERLASSLKV